MPPHLRRRLWHSTVFGVMLTLVLGLLNAFDLVFALWVGFLGLALFALWTWPFLRGAIVGEAWQALRARTWRREQGHHHSFAGVMLDIEDHDAQAWITVLSLQRVLQRRETPTATVSRVGGPTRNSREGEPMLAVPAVVAYLEQSQSRMDPRTLRLRSFLKRQVLFPREYKR